VQTVHDALQVSKPTVSLSIDVSPTALIQPYLTDVSALAPFVHAVILMDYDFHYQNSSVTGAVSPVNGAGITAEYDTETSVKEALTVLPASKIIMGIPLYGYKWETLSSNPHAAIIPGTGITMSSRSVEKFLATCASCSAQFDPVSKESFVVYKDQDTGTFHQMYYPDKQVMQAKLDLMHKYHLGGIALWALGYEGSILQIL
jgi:spore germination protein